MVETTVTVNHPAGLHLRPAAMLVQNASRFAAAIHIQNLAYPSAPEFDAKSMFGLLQCGVSQGSAIRIRADGPDEEAALAALRQLIESDFEEP